MHGLSNLSHLLIQESRTTRLGLANLPLRAGSRRPRAPVWITAVLGQISKRMPSMSNVFLHYRADKWRTRVTDKEI